MRRMVLVGKTGAGKSSSGNTFLGRKAFPSAKSASSVTRHCCKETDFVGDRQIILVDTPGLFDTILSEDELEREISKCINMTAPGPHAIILVIQLGPFTMEEHLSIEKIRAIFGQDADRYIIILFTHADELKGDIEEHLLDAPEHLTQLIKSCGGRYHAFNNKKMDDRSQVLKFLNKVDDMVACNEVEYYTSKMFQEVEQKLKIKEEDLKKEYEHKLLEQQQKLVTNYERKIKKLHETIDQLKGSDQEKGMKIKELNQLVKMKDEELNEYKRFYHMRLASLRYEAEQTPVNKSALKEIMYKLTKRFAK